MRYPELQSLQWLENMYCTLGFYPSEIAAQLGCSEAAVRTALIRLRLYTPKRTSGERVLGHIGVKRLLADARTVSSWWALANKYGVQVVVVQDHALYLDVFDEVKDSFDPSTRGNRRREPEPNPYLQSRDWIATTFGRTYSIADVARAARAAPREVERWLRYHGMTRKEMRDARNRAIVLEYEQGTRLGALSERYNLDPAGVYRILVNADVLTGRQRVG